MTEEVRQKKIKIELYNDHFQNFKRYQIPKAQLVIADIPYAVDAYNQMFDNKSVIRKKKPKGRH